MTRKNLPNAHQRPVHQIYPLRWILLLLFAISFLTCAPQTTPTAEAKPQFSIPGLKIFKKKFKKRRRRTRSRRLKKSRKKAAPRKAAPVVSAPLVANKPTHATPPLPTRNPRHLARLKKQRALAAKKNKTAAKTSRQKITSAKLASPLPPLPVRRPAHRPKTKKQQARLRVAKISPAVVKPATPAPKAPLHPSKIDEGNWSPKVIKAALQQCKSLNVKITPLAPVKKGLCGNPAPVLLPKLGTATVRPAATLSCPMVAKLQHWFDQSVQPLAQKHFGKKVQQIRNVSSYVCRNRYGDTKTRISEHAYANALDIAWFELQGGEKVSVLKHWDKIEGDKNAKSEFLHALHKSACKLFGTVLGPNANAAHKDHFHLDNAPRKRSNYCR